VSRIPTSMLYAALLTAGIAGTTLALSSVGLPFTTAAVPVVNMFLLVLILIQKEYNRQDLIAEIREEKEIIKQVARGYDDLSRAHQEATVRTLDRMVDTVGEVKQKVEEATQANLMTPWKPGDADRRSGP